MEKTGQRTTYRILLVISVILLAISATLSYRVWETLRQNKRQQDIQLSRMAEKISEFEKRIASLTVEMTAFKGEPDVPVPSFKAGRAPALDAKKKGISTENEAELQKLKDIIASTDLDLLFEKKNIDPDILSRMYSEYVERKQLSDYRQSLFERNEIQHIMDAEQFDNSLNDLYRRARFRRGEDPNSEDRKAAFSEMLERYPDAYATAMAVSERAFAAMRSRDTSGVEAFYSMLQESENESAADVVTDRGVEAVPNIEFYLARQYMRQGREQEADILIESLQNNYPQSHIFTGGRGRGPRWIPVSELLNRISLEN